MTSNEKIHILNFILQNSNQLLKKNEIGKELDKKIMPLFFP